MKNLKFSLILLSFLSFLGLIFSTKTSGSVCHLANRSSQIGYQRRENDARCEGVARRNINGGLALASLTVGNFIDSDPLSFTIPDVAGIQPDVTITYQSKDYYLEPIGDMRLRGGNFLFQWPADIMRELGIFPDNLGRIHALASVERGNNVEYVPVIADQNQGTYLIVVKCNECELKVETFHVRSSPFEMECYSNENPRTPLFVCDGKSSPAGAYTLRLSAKVKLAGSSRYVQYRPFVKVFRHNPQWL